MATRVRRHRWSTVTVAAMLAAGARAQEPPAQRSVLSLTLAVAAPVCCVADPLEADLRLVNTGPTPVGLDGAGELTLVVRPLVAQGAEGTVVAAVCRPLWDRWMLAPGETAALRWYFLGDHTLQTYLLGQPGAFRVDAEYRWAKGGGAAVCSNAVDLRVEASTDPSAATALWTGRAQRAVFAEQNEFYPRFYPDAWQPRGPGIEALVDLATRFPATHYGRQALAFLERCLPARMPLFRDDPRLDQMVTAPPDAHALDEYAYLAQLSRLSGVALSAQPGAAMTVPVRTCRAATLRSLMGELRTHSRHWEVVRDGYLLVGSDRFLLRPPPKLAPPTQPPLQLAFTVEEEPRLSAYLGGRACDALFGQLVLTNTSDQPVAVRGWQALPNPRLHLRLTGVYDGADGEMGLRLTIVDFPVAASEAVTLLAPRASVSRRLAFMYDLPRERFILADPTAVQLKVRVRLDWSADGRESINSNPAEVQLLRVDDEPEQLALWQGRDQGLLLQGYGDRLTAAERAAALERLRTLLTKYPQSHYADMAARALDLQVPELSPFFGADRRLDRVVTLARPGLQRLPDLAAQFTQVAGLTFTVDQQLTTLRVPAPAEERSLRVLLRRVETRDWHWERAGEGYKLVPTAAGP